MQFVHQSDLDQPAKPKAKPKAKPALSVVDHAASDGGSGGGTAEPRTPPSLRSPAAHVSVTVASPRSPTGTAAMRSPNRSPTSPKADASLRQSDASFEVHRISRYVCLSHCFQSCDPKMCSVHTQRIHTVPSRQYRRHSTQSHAQPHLAVQYQILDVGRHRAEQCRRSDSPTHRRIDRKRLRVVDRHWRSFRGALVRHDGREL